MNLPKRLKSIAWSCGLLALSVAPTQAQEQKATAEQSKPEEQSTGLSPAELEQLTAPIALYPDSLVSQVLMASSYPLEVVQANRWIKEQKPPLEGDALTKALEAQSWDPSVKSLVNFPSVLEQMSDKLDWTVKLGDGVLAQQEEVMAAIQRLRKRAKDEGHLKTGKEQTVTVKEEVIIIESVQTKVVYVPTYNPTVVYGAWPYPAYPPTYYYPPHYTYPSTAFSFTAGVAVGLAWGYAWGGCNWHHGDIDIDVNRNINVNKNINRNAYGGGRGGGNGNWQHNPSHRKGVRYSDNKTAQRYGKTSRAATSSSRGAYRGRTGTTSAKSGARTSSARSASGRSATSSRTGRSTTGRSTASRSTASRSATGRSTSSSRYSGSAFNNRGSRSSTTRQASRGHSSRTRSPSRGGRR